MSGWRACVESFPGETGVFVRMDGNLLKNELKKFIFSWISFFLAVAVVFLFPFCDLKLKGFILVEALLFYYLIIFMFYEMLDFQSIYII